MANRMRSWAKERVWRQRVAAWRKSGQTARDFCRQVSLSEPSFYSWRRVLAQRDREADSAPASEPTASTSRRRATTKPAPSTSGPRLTTKLAEASSGRRRSPSRPQPVTTAAFVPVRVCADSAVAKVSATGMVPDANSGSGLEVVLAAGRVVRVGREFDAATLVCLLAVLEARSC